MHTPAHVAVNLAVLGSAGEPHTVAPIVLGATLPDLPGVFLFVRERWLRGTPELVIWSEHAQRPFWRNLMHGAHSFVLHGAGLALAWWLGAPVLFLFFLSALLHAALDFPVHAEDAHRHFWPLSNYRFISPISYWDLRHHARPVAATELLLTLAACVVLWTWQPPLAGKVALLAVALWYCVQTPRVWTGRAYAIRT